MARNRFKKKGGSKNRKLSLAMVGGFTPYLLEIVDGVKKEGVVDGLKHRVPKIVGYDAYANKFSFTTGMQVWPAMIAGVVVHKAAKLLGINRALPKWLPVNI